VWSGVIKIEAKIQQFVPFLSVQYKEYAERNL
jgi:hypothetical protein